MRARFVAIGVMFANLVIASSVLFAQSTPKTETSGYIGVGRIKWEFPPAFDYTFAVPHFTVGPRIKCKGPHRTCEIRVASRDITVRLEKRRASLVAEFDPYVQRSIEKAVRIRTFGATPSVTYATLTDSRPAPGEFRLLTVGFSVNGPAVIHFEIQSDDARDIQKMLDLIQDARTMDALGIWAWRLKDYKIVCEERFPTFKEANDAAFQSSPFSSVDIIGFWHAIPPSASRQETPAESREEIQKSLERGRESYAKSFDTKPLPEKQGFCKGFPTWITEAAKDVATK